MKPNDKAYQAAIKTYNIHSDYDAESVSLRLAVDAAFVAQFPPSEDYAGLVKELREDVLQFNLKDTVYENIAKDVADALEALLAERDALKDILPNQNHEGRAPIPTDWWGVAVLERRKRRAAEKERDALLARLAPVDDEALVEIGIGEIERGNERQWHFAPIEAKNDLRNRMRNAIAAIRPHIEAVERERCARIADKYEGEWHSDTADACARAIATAIRSGK